MGAARHRATLALALVLAAPARTACADALGERLERLAGALRAGDADALADAATRGGRVRLDLRGIADARGSYSAGQLRAVLRRVFASLRTRAFRFDSDAREADEATVFARGAWRVAAQEGGAETRQTLTFVLRREDGDWRIVELRSSP